MIHDCKNEEKKERKKKRKKEEEKKSETITGNLESATDAIGVC